MSWPQAQLDASSAGDSQALTLTAAPAPAADLEVLSRGPSTELRQSEAAPGSEPSSEPLSTANGGLAQLQGAVSAVSQRHADANGSSHVNITLSGLPANYSKAAAACSYVPLGDLERLEAQSLQVSCVTIAEVSEYQLLRRGQLLGAVVQACVHVF